MHSGLTLLNALADLILPRKCIVCGEKITVEEEHICRWCREGMPLTHFWQLKHNSMADKFNDTIQKTLEEKWNVEGKICGPYEHYAYAAALFFFNEEANYKRIPYRVKYEGDTEAGRHFGTLLGNYLKCSQWLSDIDAVIPVPLHWKRRWKRGYNQAEVIADGISSALGIPVRTDILKRHRSTKTQINLDTEGKAANVAGAFVATMPDITEDKNNIRHILLVDDVFTTGSTLHACFVALRSVFPPSVRISVATLAFVGGP